jgi:hypothetical protein
MNASNDSSRSRSRTIAGFAAALCLVIVGVVAWRTMAGKKSDLTPQQKVDQFVAQVKSGDKPEWVAKDGSPQQQEAVRDLMNSHLVVQLDKYFAIPEGKARKDYLDEQIKEQEAIRKMIESDGPTTKPGQVVIKRRAGGDAASQKMLAETLPAEYQAKMAQYVKDMKDRRAERGLPTEGVPMAVFMKVTK